MRGGSLAAILLVAAAALAFPAGATAAKKPDLIVSYLHEPGGVHNAGGLLISADITKNKGKKKAPASSTLYRLSEDDEPDPSDVELDARGIKALSPGKSSVGVLSMVIPADTATGEYRVLACANTGKNVNESNEQNNCRASDDTLSVQGAEQLGCFEAAQPLSGIASGDTTLGCPAGPGDPTPACSPATGRHEWWSFTIPGESEATFSALGSDGQDLALGVYTGDDAGSELGCSDLHGTGNDPEVVEITHPGTFSLKVYVQVAAFDPSSDGPYQLQAITSPLP
jgi:CARDB